MTFLVPVKHDLIVDEDESYDLDEYALRFGEHGYLKRYVVAEAKIVLGFEYLEIYQLNFFDPKFVPGPLCKIRTIHGRKPYVVALMEHPHALQLLQYKLAYHVSAGRHWTRNQDKPLPDLAFTYGNVALGFFSAPETDLLE